jgi:hypothetical protein
MPSGIYKRPIRICKVKGCGRKRHGRGYCGKHYFNFYKYGHPLGKFKGNKEAQRLAFIKRKIWEKNRVAFICKIKGCNKKHFAKEYCKKHYKNFLCTGNPLGKRHKCFVKNCNTMAKNKYCFKHYLRIKRHLPLDLSIKCNPKGKNNHMWQGGIAMYPNHYLMKKNRLIILMQNPKCERCGKPATEIHHKDGSKTNHKLSNLMAVCHPCNAKLRTRPNIRFLATYGITQEEIAKKLKINRSQTIKLHFQNRLGKLLIKNSTWDTLPKKIQRRLKDKAKALVKG